MAHVLDFEKSESGWKVSARSPAPLQLIDYSFRSDKAKLVKAPKQPGAIDKILAAVCVSPFVVIPLYCVWGVVANVLRMN